VLIRNAPKFPFFAALENYNVPFGAGAGAGGQFLFEMSSFLQSVFCFLCLLDEYIILRRIKKKIPLRKKLITFTAHLLSLSSIQV
jgi:hypothetical protein